MHDYMIARKDILREESRTDDRAIRDFRKKMGEHSTAAVQQKSTVNVLSGLCSVLAVMVLAGGVAMFNNYKKLHEMEQVVASADPGAVIREARGGVYPSEGEKKSRESAMEVLPETMVPVSYTHLADRRGNGRKTESRGNIPVYRYRSFYRGQSGAAGGA